MVLKAQKDAEEEFIAARKRANLARKKTLKASQHLKVDQKEHVDSFGSE